MMKAVSDETALKAYDSIRFYCQSHVPHNAAFMCSGCLFADEEKGCIIHGRYGNPDEWPEIEAPYAED